MTTLTGDVLPSALNVRRAKQPSADATFVRNTRKAANMNLEELEADYASRRDNDGWRHIEARLDRAMARVMDHDRRLLELGPSERAVAHRLAVHLEQDFPGWCTDCEYNRQGNGDDRKTVSPEQPLLPPSGKLDVAEVDPGIIVHQRGPEGPNLLVLEVKPASSTGLARDRAKLRKYLTDEHLRYKFAALVTYRTGDDCRFDHIERIVP